MSLLKYLKPRWKVEASNYAQGRFDHFYCRRAAMRWLTENYNYDVLEYTDRWTGKTTYVKDRLYGRAGTPKATIVMHTNGYTEIIYNDRKVDYANL